MNMKKKQPVYFTGFNAIDYYGHHIHLTNNKEAAEYFLLLDESDEIFNSNDGVILQRGKVQYRHCTEMKNFSYAKFAPYVKKGADPLIGWVMAYDEKYINLKLIKNS